MYNTRAKKRQKTSTSTSTSTTAKIDDRDNNDSVADIIAVESSVVGKDGIAGIDEDVLFDHHDIGDGDRDGINIESRAKATATATACAPTRSFIITGNSHSFINSKQVTTRSILVF